MELTRLVTDTPASWGREVNGGSSCRPAPLRHERNCSGSLKAAPHTRRVGHRREDEQDARDEDALTAGERYQISYRSHKDTVGHRVSSRLRKAKKTSIPPEDLYLLLYPLFTYSV